jgi:hypothetical protein
MPYGIEGVKLKPVLKKSTLRSVYPSPETVGPSPHELKLKIEFDTEARMTGMDWPEKSLMTTAVRAPRPKWNSSAHTYMA